MPDEYVAPDRPMRPKGHCHCGEYTHTIPLPLSRRVEHIDYCVADIVAALEAANLKPRASCCGHGRTAANILLADGRSLNITYLPQHDENRPLKEDV